MCVFDGLLIIPLINTVFISSISRSVAPNKSNNNNKKAVAMLK